MIRIGYGYDVHRLEYGRELVLGGVDIPYEKGLLGHSDADVLLHAVCDSLLGAAALGDIGHIFPDSDERYKGASSLLLLREVSKLVKSNGYSIVNIDCTLIAQAPKISPYVEEMRRNIAYSAGIETEYVSVKATTEEWLGFTGSGDGMASTSVALIEKNETRTLYAAEKA